MLMLLFAQVSEPLSGGAGWVGAGLLGAVLAWLMFVDLPANRKQVADMVQLILRESEANRLARHEAALAYQRGIDRVVEQHTEQMKEQRSDHSHDAERDRDAFMKRSENVQLAIENQTLTLTAAIAGSCKFGPMAREHVRGEAG